MSSKEILCKLKIRLLDAAVSIIFILNQKKPPGSPRGSRNSHVNQKREELDFMKIRRSKLIQRMHKFEIKIKKSKESIFNTNKREEYTPLDFRKI
jgi:hypothetical protein